jgi:hypothetical protein
MTIPGLSLALVARLFLRSDIRHNMSLYPKLYPFHRFVPRRAQYPSTISLHFIVRSS